MSIINRFLFVVMLAITPLLPNAALAHGDHDHHEPLSETQLLEKAKKHVGNMAADPSYQPDITLGAEWKTELTSKVQKKSARNVIIAVENATAEKTVYLLMNYQGGLRSANFSGEFEDWK